MPSAAVRDESANRRHETKEDSRPEQDQLGFWEKIGYHNDGDPWRQQRRSLNLGLRVPKRFRP
jgi:hypothetical protein